MVLTKRSAASGDKNVFVGTAESNMFGARMRTTLAQRFVPIDTAPRVHIRRLFSILRIAKKKEALVNVAEIGEIETQAQRRFLSTSACESSLYFIYAGKIYISNLSLASDHNGRVL